MKKTYIKHVPFEIFEDALHYVQDAQTFVNLLAVYQKEKDYWRKSGHSLDRVKEYITNGIVYLADPWKVPDIKPPRAANNITSIIYNFLLEQGELTADEIRPRLANYGIQLSNVSIGIRLRHLELQGLVTKRRYHTHYTTKIYWSVKKYID